MESRVWASQCVEKKEEKGEKWTEMKPKKFTRANGTDRVAKLYATERAGGGGGRGERSVTKFDATTKGRSERR